MTPRPNLTTLSKQVFEGNKKRGFHEVEHSNEHCLCLVISELMEAVEADRKGRRAKWDAYNQDLNWYCNWSKDSVGYKEKEIHAFAVYIKDSIEDELADAVIRLLDLAGCRNEEIVIKDETEDDVTFYGYINISKPSFVESIFRISEFIHKANRNEYPFKENNTFDYAHIILMIEDLCEYLSIDLYLHVELKLKYNETREYKHNNKY